MHNIPVNLGQEMRQLSLSRMHRDTVGNLDVDEHLRQPDVSTGVHFHENLALHVLGGPLISAVPAEKAKGARHFDNVLCM